MPEVISEVTSQLTAAQSELRHRALNLNKRGYRVFPVQAKRPLIRDYHGELPFDEAQVDRWPWSKADSLGWALPSNMIVINVDVKNGAAGYHQLEELEELHGRLPDTALQETASGGAHLVFEVPAGLKWHDRVPLGESKANIDLCHSGHRYSVIYDDELFEQQIAYLPKIWVDALTKDPVEASHSSFRSVGTWPSDVGKLINVLKEAKKGERNDTLNSVVFKLVVDGNWSESIAELVVQAATDLELDDSEIEATMRSAIQGGIRAKERTDRWFQTLTEDESLKSRRNSYMLLQAGYQLTEVSRVHGEKFGMSCRQLGELLGVGYQSASRMLRTLTELGFLTKLTSGRELVASTYQLQVPTVANCDNLSNKVERMSHLATPPLGSQIVGHGAFIRMKGSQSLPKSCAPVLEAIHQGATTTGEVTELTGLHRSTILRHFLCLESAGLIEVASGRPKKVAWFNPNLVESLDVWAASLVSLSGANADILRLQHQMKREDYRANRQNRENRKKKSPSLSMPVIK